MEHWSKERFWEMVRDYPEYKSGELTEEQAQKLVDHLHANQEEIVRDAVTVEVNRTLMEMAAKGEVYWDSELSAWRKSQD